MYSRGGVRVVGAYSTRYIIAQRAARAATGMDMQRITNENIWIAIYYLRIIILTHSNNVHVNNGKYMNETAMATATEWYVFRGVSFKCDIGKVRVMFLWCEGGRGGAEMQK